MNLSRLKFVVIGLLACFQANLPGQVTEQWRQTYSGSFSGGEDSPRKILRDPSGNVVVIGLGIRDATATDLRVHKYAAANGALIWKRRLNLPANLGVFDSDAILDAAGNVVLTGYLGDSQSSGIFIAKLSAARGGLLWMREHHSPPMEYPYGIAVATDRAGNAIVTGRTANEAGELFLYNSKYSPDGVLVWEVTYPPDVIPFAIATDKNADLIVTGISEQRRLYTAKYSGLDGTTLWETTGGSSSNREFFARYPKLALDADGDAVVSATVNPSEDNQGGLFDWYTAKYSNADGHVLWQKQFNGPADSSDYVGDIVLDSARNVIVTGCSADAGSCDLMAIKYEATRGNPLWTKRIKARMRESYAPAAVDRNDDIVIGGSTYHRGEFRDSILTKLNGISGDVLWHVRYDGPSHRDDILIDLALDQNGNVAVTGASENNQENEDWYTTNHSSIDGALLWQRHFNGPTSGNDEPAGIVADAIGNVAITGFVTSDFARQRKWYTAKYGPSGTVIWEKRYEEFAPGDGKPASIAMDSVGNVIVAGNLGESSDAYAAKYAAKKGDTLWEIRSSAATGGSREVKGMAVDGVGNVAILEGIQTPEKKSDFWTAKLAGNDGHLLWKRRFHGASNQSDYPERVAVDRDGNVIVTGLTQIGRRYDIYTAKYAALDGAILWAKRYNDANDENNYPTGLAVDPDGNVLVSAEWVSSGSGVQRLLIKYSQQGSVLWTKPLDFQGAFTFPIAVDSSGDVYHCGTGFLGSLPVLCAAKYSGRDGALLWSGCAAPPSGSNVTATAAAIDQVRGNVLVTGALASYKGFYTACFGGTDGTLRWDIEMNEPASTSYEAIPIGITVGASGYPIVTGWVRMRYDGSRNIQTVGYGPP